MAVRFACELSIQTLPLAKPSSTFCPSTLEEARGRLQMAASSLRD